VLGSSRVNGGKELRRAAGGQGAKREVGARQVETWKRKLVEFLPLVPSRGPRTWEKKDRTRKGNGTGHGTVRRLRGEPRWSSTGGNKHENGGVRPGSGKGGTRHEKKKNRQQEWQAARSSPIETISHPTFPWIKKSDNFSKGGTKSAAQEKGSAS